MSTPLNDTLVPGQATRSSDRSGAPDTRLRGRRLILARVAWIAVVTLLVAPFLARLPAYYTLLQTICTGATCGPAQPTPDSAQALQKLGLSVATYAAFTLALIALSAKMAVSEHTKTIERTLPMNPPRPRQTSPGTQNGNQRTSPVASTA